MKMHFSIPLSEELLEKFGGRYVLYSVYLEGFLFCKLRYSQLHRWNEQLRRVFGKGMPSFPPKFYLAMTKSMADERRTQLEQYLQNVSVDPSVTNSDVFISFFRKLQQAKNRVMHSVIIAAFKAAQTHRYICKEYRDCSNSFVGASLPLLPQCAASSDCSINVYQISIVTIPDAAISDSAIRLLVYDEYRKQETFKIQTQQAFLDVYLADGRYLRIDIQTSDTAERVLEVISYKIELSKELIGYFSLFLIQDHNNGQMSVLKKLAEFELPYVSLWSVKESTCKIGIRKWYMDPSLDKMLMDCRTSVNLLYMQVVQELEINWLKPTEGQRRKLQMLQKAPNKLKFLELAREIQHYGYIQLAPCSCDYPEIGCTATIHLGNNEISCCIKLPSNQIKEVSFKINRIRCWQVTFLGSVLGHGLDQFLELRIEYNDSDKWRWIVFKTKQAFLLSSCLKKIISEQLMTTTKDDQEVTEHPESDTAKKVSIRPSQIFHSGFKPRKWLYNSRSNEDDCVFEKISEEDL